MEAKTIADKCKASLDLKNAKLSDEYYYNSLPICIIDAVFSIGIRYSITCNVVRHFCTALKIERLRPYGMAYPQIEKQYSIESLLGLYNQLNIDEITEHIFDNHNRTSSKNGILKSEAVMHFAAVLNKHRVNYFQDLPQVIGNNEFENSIKRIPGQGSGISTTYFYMLAGEENFIKPDRMIIRFIESLINRVITTSEASRLITNAHVILKEEFPELTLRILDHEIWKYQRDKQRINAMA